MIVLALLTYIGVIIAAPWWYYALIFFSAAIKLCIAVLNAASKD